QPTENPMASNQLSLGLLISGAQGRPARSFPARWPVLPLDRIYLRNARGRQPRILSRRPWSHLSDHLPLAVEVEP
ncbi:endonuclease/exonuclease/phosphatase family protein, partial [Pseudomonas aeruginosa]|uniref:endonuclease/exonuclease/phosphatase family protein n=1 Tax=Pseudomonas aeruginosa TaxID=287 RepID=UPI00397E0EC3